MIGAIRFTDWNWLLLFHLVFAFALIAGAMTVVTVSLAAARGKKSQQQVPLLRAIAFRTNLVVVLPGFIGVHVFGDLLANREYKGPEPDWLSISFSLTDIGLIVGGVLLTLLQFWVLRRVRAGHPGGWPAWVATYLPAVVLGMLVAVIVLMAGKPAG